MHNARHTSLEAGTLRTALPDRMRHALACGALSPIETELETIEDSGVRFIARRASSLARKAAPKFLPLLTIFLAFLGASLSAWGGTLPPGDYRFELESANRIRRYLVHAPPQTVSRPLPVVVSLHGGDGNARQHRQSSGMDAAADRDGYIAVYPDGSGRLSDRLLTWNAGNCCAYAQEHKVDDVAFISALLDDLERRAAIDPRRIHLAGHSNGGMVAHLLGEALPERIAAIASVAGARVPSPGSGRAVPVLHIHSEDDPRALYRGGLGPPFPFTGHRVLHPAVDTMLSAWVQRNGCASLATEKEFREVAGHTAQRLVYENCRDGAEVALWKLTGAGHGWPGAKSNRDALLGPSPFPGCTTPTCWSGETRG